jgi:DNA-binding GntR family transcriptional regulator
VCQSLRFTDAVNADLEVAVLQRLSRGPAGLTARQIAIDFEADLGSVRRALGRLVAEGKVARPGTRYVALKPLRPDSPPDVDRAGGGWGTLRSRDV